MWVTTDTFIGSGNNTFEFGDKMMSLRIINTCTEKLHFRTSQWFEHTLDPGEIFDEVINPFNTLTVNTNSTYSGLVRKLNI